MWSLTVHKQGSVTNCTPQASILSSCWWIMGFVGKDEKHRHLACQSLPSPLPPLHTGRLDLGNNLFLMCHLITKLQFFADLRAVCSSSLVCRCLTVSMWTANEQICYWWWRGGFHSNSFSAIMYSFISTYCLHQLEEQFWHVSCILILKCGGLWREMKRGKGRFGEKIKGVPCLFSLFNQHSSIAEACFYSVCV